MPAVPARYDWNFVAQDDRGFKALMRMVGYLSDISSSTAVLGALFTSVAAMGTALQAATNAKIVSTGFSFDFDLAQEPTTETGTYQLVEQKAHCTFGDGTVLREFLSIPAPKDGLFLTTSQDNLIVVNPASSLITAIQAAGANLGTPSGSTWGQQFFGGQLRATKPRRRRVLQGA
jgi:hypothetical protein